MDQYSSCCSLSVRIPVFLLDISTRADVIATWIPITRFPTSRCRHGLILLGFRRHLISRWNGHSFPKPKQFENPFISPVCFCHLLFAPHLRPHPLFPPLCP